MYKSYTIRQLAAFASALIFVLTLLTLLPRAAAAREQSEGIMLPVIMYHQVSDNSRLWGKYVVPPSTLREDFEYLRRCGCNPVSLKTVLLYTKGLCDLPPNPVVITFDDGQRSFLTKVVPLLAEFGYPAVVSPVGSLTELYTENGDTDDRYAYLNRLDIKKLSELGFAEIGNHSYDMHTLGARRGMGRKSGENLSDYREAIVTDLSKMQNLMLECTGSRPYILTYPYGIASAATEEAALTLGFTVTLTCREEVNYVCRGGSLISLGRFNRPYGVSAEKFFSDIYGRTR